LCACGREVTIAEEGGLLVEPHEECDTVACGQAASGQGAQLVIGGALGTVEPKDAVHHRRLHGCRCC
jgi:hypothetical protein